MKTMMKMILCVGFTLTAGVSQAACNFDVEVGDYLKFSAADMTVEKSCESITVNLTHSGSLPANVMGHNWVWHSGLRCGCSSRYASWPRRKICAAWR